MFLNHSTNINEVIGKTNNGTLIFLYGHVKERYIERISRMREVMGIEELELNNLMRETVKILNEYYFECKSRNYQKVRHTITGQIKIKVGHKNFILDLSVLVAGSEAKYSNKHPYEIEDQYKELVSNGELMVHDTVLAVETINITLRFDDEEPTNFTHQPKIAEYKLPQKQFKLHDRQLFYIVEFMINDNDDKLSRCVKYYINKIRKTNQLV